MDKDREKRRPDVEEYVRMNEKEKDLEIHKALIRLQNRIRKILYLMEAETKTRIVKPEKEEKKEKKR